MDFNKIKKVVANQWNQALFQIAVANLNWSRGYLWYVALEGVPHPFSYDGVLALPVTDISFETSDGREFSWEGAMETFTVPQRKGLCTLTMSVLDDEKATIYTFFERWFNSIYNNKAGVLPVTEAMRLITIYKLKSTRNPATRYYNRYTVPSYTVNARGEAKANPQEIEVSDGRNFYVFPKGILQENEKIESNPRSYQIQMNIVQQLDADYGNPNKHEGLSITKNDKVQGLLDKITDYI